MNEALAAIDVLIMATIESDELDTPPTELSDGQAFLLPDSAGGGWSGHGGDIAVWSDDAWSFFAPRAGWRVWNRQEGALLVYDGEAWRALPSGDDLAQLQNVTFLGVNTEADAINRFSVKSDAVLISHDDVTPGSGDVRLALNKQNSAGSASILFQSGWTGHGEIGLTGNNQLAIRTSTDGASFTTALAFEPSGAHPIAPQGLRVGGDDAAYQFSVVKRGIWTPTLGATRTGAFAGVTDLNIIRANYLRVGDLVQLDLLATVSGQAASVFDVPSALQIDDLPYLPIGGPLAIKDGGVHGFIYESIAGGKNNLIGGGLGRTGKWFHFPLCRYRSCRERCEYVSSSF